MQTASILRSHHKRLNFFTSLNEFVHPVLIVCKRTWLAVLEGGLIPRLDSSSEETSLTKLHRKRKNGIEEEMVEELSLGRLEIMIDWTEWLGFFRTYILNFIYYLSFFKIAYIQSPVPEVLAIRNRTHLLFISRSFQQHPHTFQNQTQSQTPIH